MSTQHPHRAPSPRPALRPVSLLATVVVAVLAATGLVGVGTTTASGADAAPESIRASTRAAAQIVRRAVAFEVVNTNESSVA